MGLENFSSNSAGEYVITETETVEGYKLPENPSQTINITKDQIGKKKKKNTDGTLKTDQFGNYLVTKDAEKMGITSGMLSSANAKLSSTSKGLEATQAAVTSGLPTMTEGAAQIISGSIAKKEKGDRLYGTCVLPNGQVIPENSNITLSW